MDDSEDYLALFFTECGELLGDLQEQLDRLMDGDRDPELVNAAFRAVHSVKGGAAAFGFDALIGFAGPRVRALADRKEQFEYLQWLQNCHGALEGTSRA